jgi:hypothetical protein
VTSVPYEDMTWEEVLALEDEYSPTIGIPTGLLDHGALLSRSSLNRTIRERIKLAAKPEIRRSKSHWKKLVVRKPKSFKSLPRKFKPKAKP